MSSANAPKIQLSCASPSVRKKLRFEMKKFFVGLVILLFPIKSKTPERFSTDLNGEDSDTGSFACLTGGIIQSANGVRTAPYPNQIVSFSTRQSNLTGPNYISQKPNQTDVAVFLNQNHTEP